MPGSRALRFVSPQMFQRMEEFDLGCTPGGGQNNQGVFQVGYDFLSHKTSL